MATWVQTWSPTTATGCAELVASPRPSWPCRLKPQHSIRPVCVTPQVCPEAALSWSHDVSPSTGVGVLRVEIVPSPSSPKSFPPQQNAVPPVVSAQVCQPPVVTDSQSVRVPTRCGTPCRRSTVPMPSCPWRFCPQHHSVPSVRTAQVWLYAVATSAQRFTEPT